MIDGKTTTAGAAAILEYFTRDDPILERNASRRVLAEVVRAWPGEARLFWWTWFTEAATSLALRTKTLDCGIADAIEMARNGTQFVCYREDDDSNGEWLAVVGISSRKGFQILVANDHESTATLSRQALESKLQQFQQGDHLRCVVMQPRDTIASSSLTDGKQPLTPLQRLWQLLQPEASDIWLVVIFAFVVSLLMLATPIAVETLVNTVAFGRFLQPIMVLAFILLIFLGFQGGIRALQTYVVEIIQRRLFARVAGDLVYRLPRTVTESTDGRYVPELVNRFFDVVTVQKVAAQLLLDGLQLALGTVIGMAVLGFYHPWLLGFDLFLLASIAVIIFVLGRGAVASAIKESKHKYYMAGWLEDIASCPHAFRSSGGPDFALERADRLIHEYLDARRGHFRIVMRQVIFALALQAIASTVLLGLGGWLVVSGELTLGQLVAAELIVTVIVGSFAKFGKHMESFYDLLASVDKLGVLFDIPIERRDGMLSFGHSEAAKLDLHALSYAWPNHPAIFEGVTAEIENGEGIAILGDAGSGKSTLLDIIYGLRNPTKGHLTIDGFNPRDLRPDVLRSRVALVRGNEIFHATVTENVRLHREGITSSEVRDVLEALGLLEPVLRLRQGCDAMLSSSGAPLSEKQQRLLGIARAAVGRPGLLLIDGTLDALGDADLDRCLRFLLAPDKPWTLIVATSRKDIAEQLNDAILLNTPVKSLATP